MIVCCDSCGRDMSVDIKSYRRSPHSLRLCGRCNRDGQTQINDQRGRHAINLSPAIHEDRYDDNSWGEISDTGEPF